VAATVACWIAAALTLWIARSPTSFEQIMRKALDAQYRMKPSVATDYAAHVHAMRRMTLACGGLFLILAVISTVALTLG
jgi:ABC-type phosphate/phosphonate transport system substrate-binding protein